MHLARYYYNNQISEDGEVAACGIQGEEEKCLQNFHEETWSIVYCQGDEPKQEIFFQKKLKFISRRWKLTRH